MKEQKHEMYFGELWSTLFKVMDTSERNGPANTDTNFTTECLGSWHVTTVENLIVLLVHWVLNAVDNRTH